MEEISQRRTFKVIGDPANPLDSTDSDNAVVTKLLRIAGNAPFHYACDRAHQNELSSPVPWRAYTLDAGQCRRLMQRLVDLGDATKVPAMLSAAEHLIQVTWLPDTETGPKPSSDMPFTGSLRNMEHIAAASAFIQSLLIAAVSEGFKTYWSSGGGLRKPEVFEILGIPNSQILLGSVFLFPDDVGASEVKPGALAEKRGSEADWSKPVLIS